MTLTIITLAINLIFAIWHNRQGDYKYSTIHFSLAGIMAGILIQTFLN